MYDKVSKNNIFLFYKKVLANILTFVVLCFRILPSFAQSTPSSSASSIPLPNLIYYDANETQVNKNTGEMKLTGKAVFLMGDVFMSADKLILQKNEGFAVAEGNVQLIFQKEKVIASKISFDLFTKQLRMDNATVFSDPASTDDFLNESVLSLTKSEIAFDKAKKDRSFEIEQEFKSLREQYIGLKNIQSINPKNTKNNEKINDLIRKYAQYLARYSRTQYQPNVYLLALPEKEREKITARRAAVEQFNKENPHITDQVSNFNAIPGYVYVSASEIIQKNNNTFLLNDAIVTPCHCSPLGEPHLFGFSSRYAQIDLGNYITMQGATFDALDVPIFYIPWFKVPIKNKRETGFLLPSAYLSNNAGQQYQIPFFLTLGPSADTTLTYELFSERGSRINMEGRLRLSKDSSIDINDKNLGFSGGSVLYTQNSFIQDKKYLDDWTQNAANINQKNPSLQNFIGHSGNNRWSTHDYISLPFSDSFSLKASSSFVSDNTYLSDFSPASPTDPTTTVYGDVSNSSMRFLNKEGDLEYYGSNTALSIRAQATQDLFANERSETPMRMPRVEFSLLPKRYLTNLPLVFSNTSTLENIVRSNGSTFITPEYLALPSGSSTSQYSDLNSTYASGKRIYSSSQLALALPANNFVNAYLSTQATGVQYYFPTSEQKTSEQSDQKYMKYSAHLDIPLYSRLDFFNNNHEKNADITYNITPFIDLNYIPNVDRSSLYPNTFQLWYAQDSAFTSATATLGISNSWTIRKLNYTKSKISLPRLLRYKDPGVANLKYFADVVKEEHLEVSPNSEGIFQISSEIQAAEIFQEWSKKELNTYYILVSKDEFNSRYIWPSDDYYELNTDWIMTPISISISTGYNFLAQKTSDEQNTEAGHEGVTNPYIATSKQDINGSLNWDLNPIFKLNGVISTTYSNAYRRIIGVTSNTYTSLTYGISFSYSYAEQYVVDPNASNTGSFISKTQQYATASYQPLNWLLFGFQWGISTDPTSTADTSDGRSYATSYNITFLNIQNCMDIGLARTKAAGVSESDATYAVSLNLWFFGQEQRNDQIGNYLNKTIHKK